MGNVTIKDVASEARLSIATVSYVLNQKENLPEETKKLVYVRNYSARSLVSKTSILIGVVIPQVEPGKEMMFENPFYSEILSSIEYNARKRGYHVMISGSNADENYFKLANQRNLDGVILIGVYSENFFRGMKKNDIPMVLVDSYLESYPCGSVQIDDEYGGYLATKYLLERGHKKIAFLSGLLKPEGVNSKRYLGYHKAIEEHKGIEAVFTTTVGFDVGNQVVSDILEQKDITAVFCTADIMTLGFIKQLHDRGVDIPGRISVIGFDNLSIGNYCTPGLTTVGQNIFEKGKKSVELICKHITEQDQQEEKIVLPVKIVERQSVKTL